MSESFGVVTWWHDDLSARLYEIELALKLAALAPQATPIPWRPRVLVAKPSPSPERKRELCPPLSPFLCLRRRVALRRPTCGGPRRCRGGGRGDRCHWRRCHVHCRWRYHCLMISCLCLLLSHSTNRRPLRHHVFTPPPPRSRKARDARRAFSLESTPCLINLSFFLAFLSDFP